MRLLHQPLNLDGHRVLNHHADFTMAKPASQAKCIKSIELVWIAGKSNGVMARGAESEPQVVPGYALISTGNPARVEQPIDPIRGNRESRSTEMLSSRNVSVRDSHGAVARAVPLGIPDAYCRSHLFSFFHVFRINNYKSLYMYGSCATRAKRAVSASRDRCSQPAYLRSRRTMLEGLPTGA